MIEWGQVIAFLIGGASIVGFFYLVDWLSLGFSDGICLIAAFSCAVALILMFLLRAIKREDDLRGKY